MKSNNNASSCNLFIDAYTYTIKVETKLEAEELKPKLEALKKYISSLPLKSSAKSIAKKVILPDSIIKKVFSYLLPKEFKEIAKICKDYKNYVLECFKYKKMYEAYEICAKMNEVQEIISKLNDQELFDQEVFSCGQLTLHSIVSLILAKSPQASKAKHIQMHAVAIISKIKYDMRNSKNAPAEVFWKYFCQKLDNKHQVKWGILSKDLKVGDKIKKGLHSFGYCPEENGIDTYARFLEGSIRNLKNTIDVFNTYFLNQEDLNIEELVKIILSHAYSAPDLAKPPAYSALDLEQLPEDLRSFFFLTYSQPSWFLASLIYNHVDIKSRLAKHPDLHKIVEDSSNEVDLMFKIYSIDDYEDDKDGLEMFIKIGDAVISHFADTLLKQFDDSALTLESAPSDTEIKKALDEIKNSTFSAKSVPSGTEIKKAFDEMNNGAFWAEIFKKKVQDASNVKFHPDVKYLHESNLAQEPPLNKWIKTLLSKMYINAEIYYVDLINEAARSDDFDYKDALLSLKVVSYILSETKENKSVPHALLAKILRILPDSNAEKVAELILDSFSNIHDDDFRLHGEEEFGQIKQEIWWHFYDYQ